MRRADQRQRALLLISLSCLALLAILVSGLLLTERAMAVDFTRKNLPPCKSHPFGTDWMGRDMLARTLCGLSMSLRIGLPTAAASALIAFSLGALAGAGGPVADAAVSWLIDLMMGIPHLLLLMLIAFACGRGFSGVVVGITATHWMSLARLVRAEVLQLRQSGYVLAAKKLGVSRFGIVRRHMAPALFSQCMTGFVLLFPHVILHEASITFLGFGLPPEQPALGILLSESMQHLAAGRWWLSVLPGLSLVAMVALFYGLSGIRGLSGLRMGG